MLLELFTKRHVIVVPSLDPSYRCYNSVRVAENGSFKNRVTCQEIDCSKLNENIHSSDYSLDNLIAIGANMTPIVMYGGSSVSEADQFNNFKIYVEEETS